MAARAAAAPAAPFARPTATQVACVTADDDLTAALRAAAQGMVIAAAATPPGLADILLSGTCGTLIIDLAELGNSAPTVIQHLASQFPDIPIIGIGTRHEEAEVAGLISSGEIYRFLHRPVSAGRAKTFLEAALRRHEELKPTARKLRSAGLNAPAPAPIPHRLATGARAASLEAVATAAAAAATRTGAMRRAPEPWYRSIPAVPILSAIAFAVVALGVGLMLRDALGRSALPLTAESRGTGPSRTAVRGLLRPAPTPAAAAAEERVPGATHAPAASDASAAAAGATPASPGVPEAADAPRKIHGARPEYPDAARASGVEGWVDLHFTVSPAGEPADVSVTGADPRGIFEDAAVAAVGRWRYAPRATPGEVDQRVSFRLSDPQATAPARATAPATAPPNAPSMATAPAAVPAAAPAAQSAPATPRTAGPEAPPATAAASATVATVTPEP